LSGGGLSGAGVAIALASGLMKSKGSNVVEDDDVEQLCIVGGITIMAQNNSLLMLVWVRSPYLVK
jgi:hypothetical protein